jgi:hypothetical protein
MALARRSRTQRTDDDEFRIPLADALAAILPQRHIIENATWFLRAEGQELVITRSTPTVTIPDPDS